MSTRTAVPQKSPAPAGPQRGPEDFKGVFGFFRKYQKPILYTAGLFALITFSITGAMMGLVDRLFGSHGPLPTIEVGGRTESMTAEDYEVALLLSRGRYAPAVVLPQLDVGEGNESDRQDMLAILRRAAIAEGMGVSDDEVDAAIEFARFAPVPFGGTAVTATQLAHQAGLGSLAEYRFVVKEAMRIGNYVRLHGLVADGSDAAILQDLLEGKEKITLQVATLDEKQLEEQLRKDGTVTDEQLRQFLDGSCSTPTGSRCRSPP
jgi:hypothetical protein